MCEPALRLSGCHPVLVSRGQGRLVPNCQRLSVAQASVAFARRACGHVRAYGRYVAQHVVEQHLQGQALNTLLGLPLPLLGIEPFCVL